MKSGLKGKCVAVMDEKLRAPEDNDVWKVEVPPNEVMFYTPDGCSRSSWTQAERSIVSK